MHARAKLGCPLLALSGHQHPMLSMSALRGKADTQIREPASANDPKRIQISRVAEHYAPLCGPNLEQSFPARPACVPSFRRPTSLIQCLGNSAGKRLNFHHEGGRQSSSSVSIRQISLYIPAKRGKGETE